MKHKKSIITYFVILGLLLTSIAMADPIFVHGYEPPKPTFLETLYQGLSLLFIALLFTIIAETFFGYIIFFRQNKKGILAILIANLISFPLFWFYTGLIAYKSHFPQLTAFIFFFIGEIAVIMIEAIILKTILKNLITNKKVIIVSIVLNLTSLLLSYMFLLF
jgi:hypothetical protein